MNKNRYLINFDAKDLEVEYHDVVIIGTGIAGLYTSLEISKEHDIVILTKEAIDISNSILAQGGIAVSLDEEDSPELHFKDTLYAGADLCNEESVWILVNEAASNIQQICKYGVNFDRKSTEELVFSREAAHSKNRIIHAGDTTGKEICDKLLAAVSVRNNIKIKEKIFVLDILTQENSCVGLMAYDEGTQEYKLYVTNIVICTSGGIGQLYTNSSNPEVSTGDGISMAYRAGVELMDLEFIQFHPTVLYHPHNKSFLISEAVRGEGAVLRNVHGERFMPRYHKLSELAPRDVVSRAIFREMKKTCTNNVYLDITFKNREYLKKRFPNIYKTCKKYGIDISKDYIPVAPAEHYHMGGIRTDVFGRTNLSGFYACGEVACTGIHGANRLASNSLLEGLVFGSKIAKDINAILKQDKKERRTLSIRYGAERIRTDVDKDALKKEIQRIMTEYVGIERDEKGLLKAKKKIENIAQQIVMLQNICVKDFEIQNIVQLSGLIVESALERKESRGAHYRSDYPYKDDENWKRNIVRSKENA